MAKEKIGYRRLYDSAGCSLASQEELELKSKIGEIEVRVYMGSQPKLGIVFMTVQGKYVVPGEISPVFTTEYKRDARESSYPRKFFTEILCIREIEVDEELARQFHAKETDAQGTVLDLASKHDAELKDAANLIAGTIGLRFHPQFVLEEVNENLFVIRGDKDWPFQITGPLMQMLEGVSLNQHGAEMLGKHIQSISQVKAAAQQFGASVLTWLLRAWPERNSIPKFLSLFIPLEMILTGYSGDTDYEKEKQSKVKQILDLLKVQEDAELRDLVDFIQKVADGLRPSLASRFEQMAAEAKIQGWEADIIAFRRFLSMRNALLHRGDGQVQLSTTISDENIEEETRHLEDLAERYVSWALFRDEVVYQSQWRAERKGKSAAPTPPNTG